MDLRNRLDGHPAPAGELVELARPAGGREQTAGLIHRQHRVFDVVQDHPGDVAYGVLYMDVAGRVHRLLQGALQHLPSGADVDTGVPAIGTDVADGTGAHQSVHTVGQSGVHRFDGAFSVHHVVKADLCFTQGFQIG